MSATLRDWNQWAIPLSLAALLVSACASPSVGRQSSAMKNDTRMLVNELKSPDTDKREFLTATSMLGKTVTSDVEILGHITGVELKPRVEQRASGGTDLEVHHAFVVIDSKDGRNRILRSLDYLYFAKATADYSARVAATINLESSCIEVADLALAFGRASEVLTRHPSPHAIKTGPNDVWSIAFILPSGARAVFDFDTQVCARYFQVSNMPRSSR